MIKSVLLVDDDPMSLLLTKEIIKNESFSNEVIISMNGLLALNEIESFVTAKLTCDKVQVPHVIFLDLEMPFMSGWEFLEYYSKVDQDKLPDTKIIILSSSVMEHDHEKAKKYSMVTKLIHKPLLNEKINSLKKNYHLQQYFA